MGQQNKGQQKKKQTTKAKNPNHLAYVACEKHPVGVLRRIIQSSGLEAAKKYAKEHGLQGVMDSLTWCDGVWKADQPHLVGRALKRHMARLGKIGRQKQLEMKKAQELAQQPTPPPAQ